MQRQALFFRRAVHEGTNLTAGFWICEYHIHLENPLLFIAGFYYNVPFLFELQHSLFCFVALEIPADNHVRNCAANGPNNWRSDWSAFFDFITFAQFNPLLRSAS